MPVMLACAAWKDRVNVEDSLFAGMVISRIGAHFTIPCDASKMVLGMYHQAEGDLYGFMERNQTSHFERLSGYGLQDDIRLCLTPNTASSLPLYVDGKLINHTED